MEYYFEVNPVACNIFCSNLWAAQTVTAATFCNLPVATTAAPGIVKIAAALGTASNTATPPCLVTALSNWTQASLVTQSNWTQASLVTLSNWTESNLVTLSNWTAQEIHTLTIRADVAEADAAATDADVAFLDARVATLPTEMVAVQELAFNADAAALTAQGLAEAAQATADAAVVTLEAHTATLEAHSVTLEAHTLEIADAVSQAEAAQLSADLASSTAGWASNQCFNLGFDLHAVSNIAVSACNYASNLDNQCFGLRFDLNDTSNKAGITSNVVTSVNNWLTVFSNDTWSNVAELNDMTVTMSNWLRFVISNDCYRGFQYASNAVSSLSNYDYVSEVQSISSNTSNISANLLQLQSLSNSYLLNSNVYDTKIVAASNYLFGPLSNQSSWASNTAAVSSAGSNVWKLLGSNTYTTCNVGIGLSVPICSLDVQGGARILGGACVGQGLNLIWNRATGSGTTSLANNIGLGTAGGFEFQNYSGTSTLVNTPLTILANGNVGIGTTAPAFLLDVSGSARLAGGSKMRLEGSSGTIALSIGGTGSISVDASGVVGGRLLLNDSGNLGVNNTSPGYKLDVGGDIRASGTLYGASVNVSGQVDASSFYTTGSSSVGSLTCTGTINASNAIYANGSVTSTSGTYGFLSSTGSTGTRTGTFPYSLAAAARIMCTEVATVSDLRGKDNIQPFADALCADLVRRIEQKHFTHTHDSGAIKTGFLAQDINKVFPNAVSKIRREVNGEVFEDYMMISYDQLTAVLWGAVRDLQTRVRLLEAK